jgi:hypothetical protein
MNTVIKLRSIKAVTYILRLVKRLLVPQQGICSVELSRHIVDPGKSGDTGWTAEGRSSSPYLFLLSLAPTWGLALTFGA